MSTVRVVDGAPALPDTPAHRPEPVEAREVLSRYQDPLEVVWLATAARLGLTVHRDPSVFSRTDGTGLMAFGPRATLDADDSLAQMLLHEVCHWITNGRESFAEEDWGFPLDDAMDPREHACLRLQAALADRHGLRGMLGPTGSFRRYWDTLGPDALAPLDGSPWEAEVARLAGEALVRADHPTYAPLHAALEATAALRQVVQPFLVDVREEEPATGLPSLWGR